MTSKKLFSLFELPKAQIYSVSKLTNIIIDYKNENFLFVGF